MYLIYKNTFWIISYNIFCFLSRNCKICEEGNVKVTVAIVELDQKEGILRWSLAESPNVLWKLLYSYACMIYSYV